MDLIVFFLPNYDFCLNVFLLIQAEIAMQAVSYWLTTRSRFYRFSSWKNKQAEHKQEQVCQQNISILLLLDLPGD